MSPVLEVVNCFGAGDINPLGFASPGTCSSEWLSVREKRYQTIVPVTNKYTVTRWRDPLGVNSWEDFVVEPAPSMYVCGRYL
jgi:hypothetical protein